MHDSDSRRKQSRRARDRQMARKRRQQSTQSDGPRWWENLNSRIPEFVPVILGRLGMVARDTAWHIVHRPQIAKIAGFLVLVIFGFFVMSHVFAGQIFPNVWAMGVSVGGMTIEEAEATLLSAWENDIEIELYAEGELFARVRPADLGLQLDARQTAEMARNVGMSGIPFGYGVRPIVTLDYTAAQHYMITSVNNDVFVEPYEAGYAWEGDQLVAVDGRSGRSLDVALTMQRLQQDPVSVITSRRLDLLMTPIHPVMVDGRPFIDAATAIATSEIMLVGYDPYRDEQVPWTTTREEITRWLMAAPNGVRLREATFVPFVNAISRTLQTGENQLRYIDPDEAMTAVEAAMQSGETRVNIRIRYLPSQYIVRSGDTGFAIARRTGLPIFLIQQANPGRNLDEIYVDDVINLPSPDSVLPVTPIPNKRIVVDLRTQTLVAFENDQVVFHWLISSGVEDAQTSPGVYQILSHEPIAYGSSYTLCGTEGCSQWQMEWFMGVYEVTPGLMNGFHGAVTLPNGAYLGGGNVGQPYTFGCIMSRNDQGRLLYDWAEVGTVVEIISDEYQPRSELARQALVLGRPA